MDHDVVSVVSRRVSGPMLELSGDVGLGLLGTVVAVGGSLIATGSLRTAFGLPVVFFLPGYAAVSALFPEAPNRTGRDVPTAARRVALGFGVSVTLLPLVGLALAVSGVGLVPSAVEGTLGAVAAVGFLVAGWRRSRLASGDRFHVPLRRHARRIHGWIFHQRRVADRVLNAAFVVAVLLAVTTLGYGLVVPAESAAYSEFSLLTESESGDLVAGDYPTDMIQGESEQFVMAVENHERQRVQFVVVGELQRVDPATGGVTERAELRRLSQGVGDGETWRPRLSVDPPLTGENLRLAFFLYTDDAPGEPNSASADEHLFLWVNSTAPETETGTANVSTTGNGTANVSTTGNGTANVSTTGNGTANVSTTDDAGSESVPTANGSAGPAAGNVTEPPAANETTATDGNATAAGTATSGNETGGENATATTTATTT